MQIKRFGWLRDKPDPRDYLYIQRFPVPAKLPSYMDLRPGCSPVEDQGDLGSCTAQALAGAVEFVDLQDPGYRDVSRLFIYYNERVLIDTVNEDSGAYLRDGIKTLVQHGVCSEELWTYDISKFTDAPTPECYIDAEKHQITHYFRIKTLDEMKACLADGYPFVFGFMVYPSFMTEKVEKTGVVNMPSCIERYSRNPIGGHAVMAVGYDDLSERFLVRNSWGTEWGMSGFFTMPYKYLADSKLSDDFWTVRNIEE